MAEVPLTQVANVLADLKAMAPYPNAMVLLVGKTLVGDGLGGFYRWDASATGTEDAYINIVVSGASSTGRWVRVFQKAKTVGGGILVNNGGVKTFYVSGTTGSNGKVTVYLTDDSTATGNPLFTEIWSMTPNPQTNATGPGDAVQSYRESLSSDLKTLVYGFYKANAVTITLGLVLTPVASIGAGTVVQFRFDGV